MLDASEIATALVFGPIGGDGRFTRAKVNPPMSRAEIEEVLAAQPKVNSAPPDLAEAASLRPKRHALPRGGSTSRGTA
jgi:hypothetical protein